MAGKKQKKETDSESEQEEYEVESIANHRVTGKSKKALQYFIKWKGYSSKDNTWEPSSSVSNAQELVEAYWSKHGGIEERDRLLGKSKALKKKNAGVKRSRRGSSPTANKRKREASPIETEEMEIEEKELNDSENETEEQIEEKKTEDVEEDAEAEESVEEAKEDAEEAEESVEEDVEAEDVEAEENVEEDVEAEENVEEDVEAEDVEAEENVEEDDKEANDKQEDKPRDLKKIDSTIKEPEDSDDYDEDEVVNEPEFRKDVDWATEVSGLIKVQKGKSGKLEALVRWNDGVIVLYDTEFIKNKYPKVLLDYYESRLQFQKKSK